MAPASKGALLNIHYYIIIIIIIIISLVACFHDLNSCWVTFFSVTVPTIWNSLPVKLSNKIVSFRHHLKINFLDLLILPKFRTSFVDDFCIVPGL